MKRLLPLIFIANLMAISAIAADAPTGASRLWTSTDPLMSQARELVNAGELSKAEALLREHAGDDAAAEGLDVIRRIRHDYSLSAVGVLKKLSPQVRDLTAADLERWTASREIQWRLIDGRTAYFRREPANVFRFCPDAIARKVAPAASSSPAFVLNSHCAEVIVQASRTGEERLCPVRHTVTFKLTVPANAAGARAGSVVRAWLPFPQQYRQQSDVVLVSAGPAKPVVAENGAPHRTLYFEQRIEDPSRPMTFEAVFAYTSHAYYPALEDAKVQPLPADFPAEFLAERPPHIRFSPAMKQTAAEIVGDETNPLAKARRIFHWINAKIRYHAEEEYGIIPSFSEHALTRRRGDCGVQATLFVTLCRAAGVPARWQSGWQTRPGNVDMHDWAEIYVAPWGWLPVDPSYGLNKSDDPAVREFYFGHQDSYRMIVNLDYGRALTPAKASLRSEPADFQRGEVEIDGRNLYFDQFEYDCSVTQRAEK